jgi:hypothetical protein
MLQWDNLLRCYHYFLLPFDRRVIVKWDFLASRRVQIK